MVFLVRQFVSMLQLGKERRSRVICAERRHISRKKRLNVRRVVSSFAESLARPYGEIQNLSKKNIQIGKIEGMHIKVSCVEVELFKYVDFAKLKINVF